jgi:hypothetical protein
MVGHRRHLGGRRVDGVGDRVVEVATHQRIDVIVERGGKQQTLAPLWGLVEQSTNCGEETKVGEVVGLIEHRDLHGVEPTVPLIDEILETAGRRHHHVDALVESGHLWLLADSAVHEHDALTTGPAQRHQGVGHLNGKFTSGDQNQPTRSTGLTLGVTHGEATRHREGKRNGLARPGPSTPEQIPAGEGIRKGG